MNKINSTVNQIFDRDTGERILKSLLLNSPNFVSVFDLQGRFIAVGTSLQKLLGKDEKDLLGKKLHEALPETYADVLNKSLTETFVNEQTSVSETTFQIQNSPISIFTSCFPVHDNDGVIFAYCAISLDVTERQQAEIMSKEIVDNIPSGAHIYEINSDGKLVFIGSNESANKLLGTDHRPLIGKTIEEAFPGVSETEIPSKFKAIATNGGNYFTPKIVYNVGEIEGALEVHAIQLSPNRMASFFRDITELSKSYDAAIVGWSRAMDARDKETEGHSQRVTEMTLRLARALGVSESKLVYFRWGALLHDIGKIGIPDSVLLKPGKLSDEEWAIMRKHPEIAYKMLSPIRFLGTAIEIPIYHHEKWNGTGYPLGLKGEQIPLSAQIFAVADVFDALCSDRPYREGWPKEKAVEYIKSEAGKHFSPLVVEVFLKEMDEFL
jgi:PAS domain S-box-containing protein/putative nucleotidyltransferase with HDIG domain